MNYLNNDELERYWFRYKAEYEPHGIALEQFCNTQKISYRAMDNWRRQIQSKVVPVEIVGVPQSADPAKEKESGAPARSGDKRFVSCSRRHGLKESEERNGEAGAPDNPKEAAPVRIMVTIKATNGLSVFQKNLSYDGLRLLVERLEGVC